MTQRWAIRVKNREVRSESLPRSFFLSFLRKRAKRERVRVQWREHGVTEGEEKKEQRETQETKKRGASQQHENREKERRGEEERGGGGEREIKGEGGACVHVFSEHKHIYMQHTSAYATAPHCVCTAARKRTCARCARLLHAGKSSRSRGRPTPESRVLFYEQSRPRICVF